MFCHNCGAKLADTSKFCIKCGTSLQEEIQVIEPVEVKPIDKKKFIVPLSIVVGVCIVIFIFVKIVNMPDRSFNTETLADDVVFVFKDEELKKAVEEYLGVEREQYTYGELKNIKKLVLESWQGYQDLSELRYFTSLEELHFEGCLSLTDISVIGELQTLRTLRIVRGDSLTDISPLAKLKELECLELQCGDLEDISPLCELTNLKELTISYYDYDNVPSWTMPDEVFQIKNVNSLSNLVDLEVLRLRYCGLLNDISALGNLHKLEILEVRDCNLIDNIESIGNLTKLKELTIRSSSLADIAPLSNLINLEKLEIRENSSVDSFAVYELLPNLQNLICSDD